MGLDLVELVLGIEDAFHIAIPNTEAARIRTPRHLVEYVSTRLDTGPSDVCLTQRAFYRLRSAAMRVFELPRTAVTVDAAWPQLLPSYERRHNWELLKRDVGTSEWPRLTFRSKSPSDVSTVGGTARYLAERAPASLKKPGEPWDPCEIEKLVASVMNHTSGITDFDWDDDFVHDLGLD